MPADRALAALGAAALVLLAACNSGRIDQAVGHGGFSLRTTTLHVDDTMTVRAGAIYNNGRFVADPGATFHAANESVLHVDSLLGVVRATAVGSTTLIANLRAGVSVDTTITVVP